MRGASGPDCFDAQDTGTTKAQRTGRAIISPYPWMLSVASNLVAVVLRQGSQWYRLVPFLFSPGRPKHIGVTGVAILLDVIGSETVEDRRHEL